ncbi:MAG: hypothetical protein LBG17_00265 [Bacteroidales bacterium]|jgi:hypothetical protein|nr:hypothetical protein [Bacteroidales bacterium]
MGTLAQQYSNYNAVRDMVYRLSEKDRTRLIRDIINSTEKTANKEFNSTTVSAMNDAMLNRNVSEPFNSVEEMFNALKK